MKTNKRSESGQAMILILFAIIAMLGFAALAIDGGMVYADRRHAQSSSDAASLAGGGFAALSLENYHIYFSNFDCSMSDLTTIRNNSITVAENRAVSNGFDASQVTVTTICEDDGSFSDPKYLDVTTRLVKQADTALIHFVYPNPVVNEVEATVRVRPRSPLAFGNAIVALNDEDCSGNSNGVIVGGSSGTYVHGGGIFSNGCLKCNGSGPNFDVVVDPPDGIVYVGTAQNCGSDELDPAPTSGDTTLPPSTYLVDPPDCSGLSNLSMPGGRDVTLNPGVYSSINDNGKDSITLNPGLYCVTGSSNAVKITSGSIIGEGVTIYVINGDVRISGGGGMDDQVYLTAPVADPDPSPAIPGILIFLAPGNTQDVQLTGNSESIFTGTVYVPDGDIIVTGTGDLGAPFHTQLIGMNVEIDGNAYIDMNFDSAASYSKPSALDLNK